MIHQILLAICLLFAVSYAWTIDGSALLPAHQIGRNHEANYFKQRFLSAFRTIDPHVSESTLDRFTRFVREDYD
ncbi:unnamed protein product [Caenorhabditis angaria]|uniref:Uncharacterized protein n=1 Tax=Caenorhabditis angaria TaxID=860376 RepID=A0A9P1ILI5_9PELO|nr:unnamed protein product [Caenorhabditis angaria]